MKWTNKGHQFDEVSNYIINPNTKYYIWGAGTFGESFYEEFHKEINIIGFIDSNKSKQGKICCDINIYDPEILKKREKNISVLVSAGWTKAIFSELSKYGYKKNIDCFHIDEFSSIYMMYKYNKLCFTNLTYVITQKCTLKCKHCLGYYPYYKEAVNIPINQIMSDLDLYFSCVDRLNMLGISGGDAMLHPQFNEILNLIGSKYYEKKVQNIEIYTNAIIIPSEQTIELFKKYNIFYRFTDYNKIEKSPQKIDEIIYILEKNNIRYDRVNFDTWYDSGFPQESNGIKKEEDLIKFCEACDRRSCQGLKNGKLYFCDVVRSANEIEYCELEESDYFNLNDKTDVNKYEFMEYMLGYSDKGYYNFCRKCNGGQNVNKKYVPAGIQL